VEGLWLNLAGNCPPSGGRQHYLRIISQMGQLFSRAKPAIINGLFHASGGFIPLYGERLPVIQFKEFALISMIQQQPQRKHQTGDILPKILYNEIICPLIRRLIHADEIELRIKVWLQCAAEAGFISSDGLLKVIDVVLLACSLARPDAEIANEKMTPWVDVLIGQLLGRFCRAIIVSPSSEYIEDDTPSSDDGDSYYLLPYTATATHWLLQCCRQNAELAVQIKKRMWRLFQSQCTQWAVHSAARHTVRSLLICLRGDRRSTDIAEYAKHWLSLFPPEDLFTAHYNSSGKNKRKVF
jgi:hypothetical protein